LADGQGGSWEPSECASGQVACVAMRRASTLLGRRCARQCSGCTSMRWASACLGRGCVWPGRDLLRA
jgi:hypothetical protein